MVTRRVLLRTGTPVWLGRKRPPVDHAAAKATTRCEVLVVGAGISGAMVADALSQEGLEVVLVDRRRPIGGSSAASTALLQSDLDIPLSLLAKKVGWDKAARHYRRAALALTALRSRASTLPLDVSLRPREALYLAGNLLDGRGLLREGALRRQAGLESDYLSRAELKRRFGFSRAAALWNPGQLEANPVQMTAGFLRAAQQRGARLFTPVDIAEVNETRTGAVSTARDGSRFLSRFVVYATGYELPFAVPQGRHALNSTWAIATRAQPSKLWPTRCLVWEAADPYLYVRTTLDGRIICGGADEEFKDEAARDALLAKKTAQLERALGRLLPEVDPHAQFAWTGTFGATPTSTPSIGRLPGKRRTYCVLGYGGNGFTFSMIAAQVLRGELTGKRDPDAQLYAF